MHPHRQSMTIRSVSEHFFNADPIPARRIVEKNVRYRSDQFSVLQDRAATHPLNDPACFTQQFFIRYFDDEIFVAFIPGIHLCDGDLIFLWRNAVYRRIDNCLSDRCLRALNFLPTVQSQNL